MEQASGDGESSSRENFNGVIWRRNGRDTGNDIDRDKIWWVLHNSGRRRGRPGSSGDQDIVQYGSLYFRKMNIECTISRALHFLAERKKTSSYINLKFSGCCSNGLIASQIVPRFSETPEILKQLLSQSTPDSRSFRRKIRKYNRSLAMASVTSNRITPNLRNSCFNPTLTIQGRLYYFIGPLNPSEGLRPMYSSVYIHDSLQNESDKPNHSREDFPALFLKLYYSWTACCRVRTLWYKASFHSRDDSMLALSAERYSR